MKKIRIKIAGAAVLAIALMMLSVAAPAISPEEAEADPVAMDTRGGLTPWSDLNLILAMPNILMVKLFLGNQYDPQLDAGAQEAVKAFGRKTAKEAAVHEVQTVSEVASGLVSTDTQTWHLTQLHLDRAAEISASTMWAEGRPYEPDRVLDYGGVYGLVGNGYYNTQYTLDYGYRNSADRVSAWKSKGWAAPIQSRLVWQGGQTPAATSTLGLDFCTIAESTASANLVYLVDSRDADQAYSNAIYSYGHTGTLTPVAGGSSYGLSAGANDISALPGGWYRLTPGTYGGPFLSSTSEDAAEVTGGATIICDSQIGYAMPSPGGDLEIWWSGNVVSTPYLRYSYSSDGETFTTQLDGHDPVAGVVASWGDQIAAQTDILFKAAVAGQVMWTIFANAKAANPLLSPSAIAPQLVNVGVSADQSYAMYVSALDQIASYNESYGGVLKAADVKISQESLELYCHGSIYSQDGMVIATDVIFSPYVYIRDMMVRDTGFNILTQDATCMIWSESAASAAEWMGSDPDSHKIVVMTKGSYFTVTDMVHKGKPVSSVLLKVKEIRQMDALRDIPMLMSDPPKVLSAERLILMIVVELGIIIGLLGYIFKIPQIMVAGAVVIVLGFILSGWISRVALGAEGFWDWLPFQLGGGLP